MVHMRPKESHYVQIEDNDETRKLGIANCYGYISSLEECRFYVCDQRPSHLIGLPEIPISITLKGPIIVEQDWVLYIS